MRRRLVSLAAVLILAPLGAAQPDKAAPKAAPPAKARGKTAAKTQTKAKSRAKTAARAPARPATQQQPTKERYAEIQQALVDRGYLEIADGNWGPQSVAALKKFQQDQQLPADGKLGALSLTALGLGPRHGAFVLPPQAIPAGSAPAVPLD
jgi:peptidoglycan hydrolase-like protein with peptidoglycan-binding domain